MLMEFNMPYGRSKKFDVRLEHYTVREFMGKEMKGLAVALYLENGETGQYDILSGLITKNFGEFIGYKNTAYIDLNNSPFATELLQKGFAVDTGFHKDSGFCKYPLWEFKEEFLKQMGEEKYKQYSDEYDKYMKEMFSPDE